MVAMAGAYCVNIFLLLMVSAGPPASGFPVPQQPHHKLDLELLEYTKKDNGEDHDLVLEFKSHNLSGVVQLKRVIPNAAKPTPSRSRYRNRQRDRDQKEYDQTGAMYFAVSVVSLYGLSIGVLVAFSVRRDSDEDEVKSFQRSWGKIDHMMEKQEKQRAKRLMTRAIIAIHQPRRTSNICAAVSREAVYMALAPVTRPHDDVLLSGRRCSREVPAWSNLPPPMLCIQEDVDSPKVKMSTDNPQLSNFQAEVKEPPICATVEMPDFDLSVGDVGNDSPFECEEEADIWRGTPPLATLEEAFVDDPEAQLMPSSSRQAVYSIEDDVELWQKPPSPGNSPALSEPTSECARIHLGLPSPQVPYMDDEEGPPPWPQSPDTFSTYL